jgi:hypothetical protein
VADHQHGPKTVLVSSETGGRPERYKRGIDFVLTLHEGHVTLMAPGAHARNSALLHDARWQALNIALEGNRTLLQGRIPAEQLTAALEVLGSKTAWYAPADYREWYNRIAENGAEDRKPHRNPSDSRDSPPQLPYALDGRPFVPRRRSPGAPGG